MRRHRIIQGLLVGTCLIYMLQVLFAGLWHKHKIHKCQGGACHQSKEDDFHPPKPVTISTIWRDLNQKREELKQALIQVSEEEDPKEDGKKFMQESHELFDQMGEDWHWAWIKKRVISSVQEFEAAFVNLTEAYPAIASRKQRKILVLPGLLTITNFARAEVLERGSPLGELVQWADLISGLHILGHDITLMYDIRQMNVRLRTLLDEEPVNAKDGCRMWSFDIIYTDIGGFRGLWPDVRQALSHKFRVLDAFGTEPAYNDGDYAEDHGIAIRHWGMLELPHPLQFYTFYPHTPDNSFLGFTISKPSEVTMDKKNVAIIMGKESRYLHGHHDVLNLVQKYFEVHVTIPHDQAYNIPRNVFNHGILASKDFKKIAASAKVVVGLGDPIESPGPLECLAMGCVFINPLKTGQQQDQLRGKPTSRKISSQNDYLLKYVKPPHVYSVDYSNLTAVEEVLKKIQSTMVHPFLPYEFSVEGYIQRLDYFLEHQNFCSKSSDWPPEKALHLVTADHKTSCSDACFHNQLFCEPEFFSVINNQTWLSLNGVSCKKLAFVTELHAPAVDSNQCLLQADSHIFSCAGQSSEYKRLCPCRTHRPFQVAICSECI